MRNVILCRTPLTKHASEKTRNSLAKGLFENLFRELVQYMNEYNSSSLSTMYSIGILDIAGFGIYYFIYISLNS